MQVQRLRRAQLLHPPLAHQGDAVSHEHCLLRIMGDDQRRNPRLLQHMQRIVAHLLAQPGIKAGKGLIEQQRRRAGGERTGQRHTLLLPAGELMRPSLATLAQAHTLQRLPHPGIALGARQPLQAKAHILGHGEMGEKRVILKHKPHPPRLGQHVAARLGQGHAIEGDAAMLQGLQPRHQAQQRGLAIARGA